jgi:hypothetical protein
MISIKFQSQRIGFLALVGLVVFSGDAVMSQDLNKEVYVVRPYEPTLSDATKYNFLPSVSTIETQVPQFKYSISPRRLENSFEPDPIKAAKTVTASLPKIYNSWLKLGMGNYNTPLVEFNISNLRSKESAFGAYMRHKSSHGDLTLDNNDKVNAGYVENNISLYGKRFFSGSTLSGNLRFDQHAFNFYGYNTDLIPAPPNIDKDSLRQRTFNPGIDLGIKSNYEKGEKLNYDFNASYDFFIDRQKNKESSVLVNAGLFKDFSGLTGGLDMSLDYTSLSGDVDSLNNTIFRFNPWIGKSSEDWQFKLGFEATADISDITKFYFYPRANLDFTVIKDVLIPFVGVSGNLQKNSYKNLFEENMFIKPGLVLKNTSSNFIVYGGLKGNISSMVGFRADVTLTMFKNYHFFVNDTTNQATHPLHNQFTGVYDDVDLITYHGQLAYNSRNKFGLVLDGKYFKYSTLKEAKPWHMPDFKISLDATYAINKFEIGAGFDIIGNRWVQDFEKTDDMRKLKPVFDGNLKLNYHYSKLLTVFIDLYNITERSYMVWNQYPAQRFNFLIGFSYKL